MINDIKLTQEETNTRARLRSIAYRRKKGMLPKSERFPKDDPSSHRWSAYYLYRKGLNPDYKPRSRSISPDINKRVLCRYRYNAKCKGVPFNLTLEDIKVPEFCPILGIPLARSTGSHTDSSPSLDRIDPSLGYVRGNVIVISYRANRIKNDATIPELQKISDFYNKLASTTPSPDNNVTNKDLVNPG